jgi:hypothetical protein
MAVAWLLMVTSPYPITARHRIASSRRPTIAPKGFSKSLGSPHMFGGLSGLHGSGNCKATLEALPLSQRAL